MSKRVEEALAALVGRGFELANGKTICAALRDLCPTDKRAIHVVGTAIKLRVVADLRARSGGEPFTATLDRLAARLTDEAGLDPGLAHWVVRALGGAVALADPELARHLAEDRGRPETETQRLRAELETWRQQAARQGTELAQLHESESTSRRARDDAVGRLGGAERALLAEQQARQAAESAREETARELEEVRGGVSMGVAGGGASGPARRRFVIGGIVVGVVALVGFGIAIVLFQDSVKQADAAAAVAGRDKRSCETARATCESKRSACEQRLPDLERSAARADTGRKDCEARVDALTSTIAVMSATPRGSASKLEDCKQENVTCKAELEQCTADLAACRQPSPQPEVQPYYPPPPPEPAPTTPVVIP